MCVTASSISHGSSEISDTDYASEHEQHDFLFLASHVPASEFVGREPGSQVGQMEVDL